MTKPKVLVVIPARGGSKGVPGKNVAPVGGRPLVGRAVAASLAAPSVTAVAVSTDDDAIAAAAQAEGALIVTRPAELAGDTATSESAVLHALDAWSASNGGDPDVVVMVQCTSPFLTTDEVEGVVRAVLDGADTAFTAAPTHGFLWRTTPDGAVGVNHDKAFRPRRQDREQEYLETGNAYAARVAGFREHRHRFFGRTELIATDPARVLEIDEPQDLERARLLAAWMDDGSWPTIAELDALVLDFDGTQTDDRVLIDLSGDERVQVHRGDGLGISALKRAGLPVAMLSTEKHAVITARARKLDVPVAHGAADKGATLREWCERENWNPQRVMYVGNDVNDLAAFAVVGWPVAVASAHPVVRRAARLVTRTPGGFGAIREIASQLLQEEKS